jgi:hypothetical protein
VAWIVHRSWLRRRHHKRLLGLEPNLPTIEGIYHLKNALAQPAAYANRFKAGRCAGKIRLVVTGDAQGFKLAVRRFAKRNLIFRIHAPPTPWSAAKAQLLIKGIEDRRIRHPHLHCDQSV